MPHRPNRSVRIELANCISALFSRERVPLARVRDIIEDPHLFDILHTILHDMMTLIRHVVGTLIVI